MERRYIFLLLIIAMLISFIFDNDIVILASSVDNGYVEEFFAWVTNFGSTIIVMLFMTSLLLWETRKREWLLPLWASFLISGGLTLILKFIVNRARPFETLNLGVNLVFPGWNTSFPSWHAAAAFAAVAILDREFPRFKWFWIGFAVLVAFSRVYIGAHFLSDVIAGAIVGYGIGLLIFRLENKHKWLRNFGRKKNKTINA